jgi:hypothetical protein
VQAKYRDLHDQAGLIVRVSETDWIEPILQKTFSLFAGILFFRQPFKVVSVTLLELPVAGPLRLRCHLLFREGNPVYS